jgi:hypothetical protein
MSRQRQNLTQAVRKIASGNENLSSAPPSSLILEEVVPPIGDHGHNTPECDNANGP